MNVGRTALFLTLLLTLSACGAASTTASPSAPPGTAPASTSPAAPAQASASASAPGAAAKDKVRAGYLSHSTTAAVEFISKNAGLYDKYGLNVDLTFLTPAVLTTALNAGQDFDVGYASAANIPTVNVKGGDLVMIAGSAQGGIFSVIAVPGINSIADLKGKKAG